MYRITSLRQDKITYAVDACALNLVCLLIFFLAIDYFDTTLRAIVSVTVVFIAVTYTIFMAISNTFRLFEIKRLEQLLK